MLLSRSRQSNVTTSASCLEVEQGSEPPLHFRMRPGCNRGIALCKTLKRQTDLPLDPPLCKRYFTQYTA